MIIKNIIRKFNFILQYNNHNIIKAIQIISLLGLPFNIGILVYNFTWFYFFITLISIILISKIGHSVGQHRYFCHKSFTTTRSKEVILIFLSTICTTYSAIYYSAVHRFHHIHSDSDLDPHKPEKQGIVKSFLGFVDIDIANNIPGSLIKDLLRDKLVVFFHRYYLLIILLFCLCLLLIDPLYFILVYLIPIGYTQFVNGSQVVFGHNYGYKNFNLKDNSTNNIFWNWITLGEGLHNNHHNKSTEYDFAYTNKKFEYDVTGKIIKLFFVK